MNAPSPNGHVGETPLDAATLARLHDLDPGGKSGIVARVLRTYEQSLAATLQGLQAAQGRGDLVEVRRLAHTLKSSSGSVGALGLAADCAEVEALARDRQEQQLPAALERLGRDGLGTLLAVRRLLES